MPSRRALWGIYNTQHRFECLLQNVPATASTPDHVWTAAGFVESIICRGCRSADSCCSARCAGGSSCGFACRIVGAIFARFFCHPGAVVLQKLPLALDAGRCVQFNVLLQALVDHPSASSTRGPVVTPLGARVEHMKVAGGGQSRVDGFTLAQLARISLFQRNWRRRRALRRARVDSALPTRETSTADGDDADACSSSPTAQDA